MITIILNMYIKSIVVCLALSLLGVQSLYATDEHPTLADLPASEQTDGDYKAVKIGSARKSDVTDNYKQLSFGRSDYNFWSHFSISTNLVDWALVIPNIGLDIDFGNPNRKSTSSIFLQFKGSPSSKDYLKEGLYDKTSYKFWNAHLEWRLHWSFMRHPELAKGRFYTGVYTEYMKYTLNTPLDIIDPDKLKDGWAGIAGISAGYDFPGFDYDNRHFFQFQIGANIGAFYADYDAYSDAGVEAKTRILPMITEIRFALAYRNHSISRKYWQPNLERYRQHQVEDEAAREQIDKYVEEFSTNPLTIYVKQVTDTDTAFVEPVTFNMVRREFSERCNSQYFRPEQLYEIADNTKFPITKPSDFCLIGYTLPIRATDYDSEDTEAQYVFPFRVRFLGYEQAMDRMLSYNRALRQFFNNNGRRLPTMNMEAVNSTDFVTSATIENVLEMLNGKWMGGNIKPDEVDAVYYRENDEFHKINETEMNRRGTYALGLRFHSQVHENYDSLTTRFNLEPYVETDTRTLYEQFVPVVTRRQFSINHTWKNGKEGDLTKQDVLNMLAAEGFVGFNDDNISVDSIHYGRNYGEADFGKVLPKVRFIYVVEDSLGLAVGQEFHHACLNGLNAQRGTWNTDYTGQLTYGPICEGMYDAEGNLVPADKQEVIDDIMRCLTRVNKNMRHLTIDESWIEDYTYTGLHDMPNGKNKEKWTLLRFAYRYVNADGRVRLARAHAAYRIKVPKK